MPLTSQSPDTAKSSVCSAPLVSIIMGNYNYGEFIRQAIDSALNQTYKNVEVIVVDDGSTDDSREIISSYGNKVVPIFKDNSGQHANYNAGFAASRGEIICFLDSDDWFVAEKIEKLVAAFQSSEAIGWCFHSVKLVDKNNNPLPKISETQSYTTHRCDYRKLLKLGKLPPCIPPSSALSFERSVLEKILPMPTAKAVSSSDHYVKFMAVGLSEGFILGDALTIQKIHGNNAASGRKDVMHLKARKFIYSGLWVKQNFPNLQKFSNKLLAVGVSWNWASGNNDFENNQAIKDYFRSSSLEDRIQVNYIGLYYYLKERLLG